MLFQELDACNESRNENNEYCLRFLRDDGRITYACYTMNGSRFKYEDPLLAFIGLFAKMSVFNIPFPKLCNHVWQFVQQGIFGIPIENAIMCHTTQVALKATNM